MFGSRRALLNKVLKGVPLTITRASTANLPDGTSVPPNTGRFVTIAGKRGILIEEGTTNFLTAAQSLPQLASSMGYTTWNSGTWNTSYENIGGTNKIQLNSAVLTATYPGSKTYTIYTSKVTVSPNSIYTCTVHGGFSIDATTCSFSAEFRNSSDSVVSIIPVSITPDGSITKYTLTVTAPENAVSLQIYLKANLVNGARMFWNAGQIENKAYSTSWTLGGTTRQPEILSIDPKVLNLQQGTFETEIYVPSYAVICDPNSTVNLYLMYISLSNNGYIIMRLGTSGGSRVLMVAFSDGTGTGQNHILTLPYAHSLTAGYHKFAMTWIWNGSVFTLASYIDGVKVAQNTTNGWNPTGTTSQLMIGSRYNGDSSLNSINRNISISKSARIQTEIQSRANANTYPIDNQVTAFALLESNIRGVASA